MRIIFILTYLLFAGSSMAQSNLRQTIKGNITDFDSKRPIQGATIVLLDSLQLIGTVTDSLGNFRLESVAIGRQSISISSMGYENKIIAEIMVTSGKEVFLTVPLVEKLNLLEEVTVAARKNKGRAANEFAGTSARSFSVEETKRYAATAFDPARMAQNFAGVSNNGDDDNSIVVRGNSPRGVLWRLEGIEIPNPNHFGGQGGSGGPISMLSSSTLGNSDFYTGAFPAEFGNALSGAFDLKFRDGNKDKPEHSFMIGGLGIEASSEGPFKKGGASSYLINYRYSTLALLQGFLDLQGILPAYQDLSFKLTFPTKKTGVFTLFGIGGLNKAVKDPGKDSTQWDDDNPNFVIDNKGKLGVIGISHQVFLNKHSYLKTILSASGDSYYEKDDTLTASNNYVAVPTFYIKATNHALRLSVLYNNKLNSKHTFRTGVIVSRLAFNYNNRYYDDEDAVWKNLLKSSGNTIFYQAYIQWKYRITNTVTLNTGLHASLFSLNNKKSIEPRIAVSYQPNASQLITISGGLHTRPEHLSTYFYEKRDAGQPLTQPNKNLDLTRALHFVLAYDKNFSNGIRFKTEIYYQHLYKVPVEKEPESFFSMINVAEIFDLYQADSALISKGKGTNYGIDISLEKSFTKNYYFLGTASFFKSTYTTYPGKTFSTRYDRNYQVNIVTGKEWKAGKEKRKIISLNGKILAGGGLRNSPIDYVQSRINNETVYVKDKYFTEKGNPYYRLDIGFGYKINRKKTTHSFMLDFQNVTNHKNLFLSYYDEDKQAIKKIYQMGFFPIINYRVEF